MRNPVQDAFDRGDTPTMADLVERCADLEATVSAAVVLLARVSQRAITRGDTYGLNVLVSRQDLRELEAATDAVRGAGYVAGMRRKHGRGARGGAR